MIDLACVSGSSPPSEGCRSSSKSDKMLFDIENSEFLSIEEAAFFFRTTKGSIRNATSNGKIPPRCYRKFGRRILYIKSELRKLLLGGCQEGESDGN